MPISPGRNSIFENFFRAATGFVKETQRAFTGQTAPRAGNYATFSSESLLSRNYDEEAISYAVRDPFRASKLNVINKAPEVKTAIRIIRDDVFSSESGDSDGFMIGAFRFDGETPVDPNILRIANACINRVFRGETMGTVVKEFLSTGDSFRSIILDDNFKKVVRLKALPTWEMFRVEDGDENILRFEQRKTRSIQAEPEFVINPVVCVHWRYDREQKYGQALFEESKEDVDSLALGYRSLDRASTAVGINPNIHIMPTGSSDKIAESYKQKHEDERRRQGGMITDYYVLFGGDVKKVGQGSDVTALVENVGERRQRLNMQSRVPPWMMGIPSAGAKDISGQPALSYARYIGAVRAVFAEGVRQVINLELALNDYSAEDFDYEIVFPKFYTEIQQQSLGSSSNNYNKSTETNPSSSNLKTSVSSFGRSLHANL